MGFETYIRLQVRLLRQEDMQAIEEVKLEPF